MLPCVKRVCVLVANPVETDPRVRKQLAALSAAGRYEVRAIGVEGDPGRPREPLALPGVTIEHVPANATLRGVGRAFDAARRLACLVPSAAWARHAFFAHGRARALLRDRALAWRADLYHANDWTTLPVAAEAARAHGARLVYDSHEMGILEFEDARFRFFRRPLIERVERHYLPRADRIVAVCASIARELVARYGLDAARASVVRNATESVTVEPHALDPARVRVLYHGGANAGRGLEDLLDSVALWSPHLSLWLRVVGRPAYLESLRARAAGLGSRVTFLPPVPIDAVVREAAPFDVGIHPIVGSDSFNNRVCLPNKLFEYAMAGLAVFVTDLPEMRALVHGHGLGATFAERDPAAIAAALNAATPESLARARENALRFSREVNAATEFAKLVLLYDELLA